MARNAIESEFRISKMADGSHFVKNFQTTLKLRIDLKWPEMRNVVQPFCKKNHIYIYQNVIYIELFVIFGSLAIVLEVNKPPPPPL